jgi:hypothetical protein
MMNITTSQQVQPRKPLLCLAPRYQDEALLSFLFRLAKHNGYDPPRMLIQYILDLIHREGFRGRLWRPTEQGIFDLLAELTLVMPQALRAALPPMYMCCRRQDDLVFCAPCVAEAAYYRMHWMVDMCTACPRHRCLLLTHCTTCRKRMTLEALMQATCGNCRTPVSEMRVVMIDHDRQGLMIQQHVQSWIIHEARPSSFSRCGDYPDVSVKELYTIIWNWSRHAEPELATSQRPRLPHSSQPPSCQWTHIAYDHARFTTAITAVQHWPYNFYKFLSDVPEAWESVAHISDVARNAYTTFVGTYLLPALSCSSFAPPSLQQKRHSDPYITIDEARYTLQLSHRVMQHLMEAQTFVTEIVGHTTFICATEVHTLKHTWSAPVDIHVAARWLGVPIKVVYGLIQHGLLPVGKNMDAEDDTATYVLKSAIITLIDTIRRREERATRYCSALLLEHAAERNHVPVADILCLIVMDRISCWRDRDASVSPLALRVYPGFVRRWQ